MFSLQRLFGTGDKCFGLLTASAEEGLNSVQALQRILKGPSGVANLDELVLEELLGLYSGQYGAVVAIAFKDLYEILEKAIDHCRDAGNVVGQVVIKHS